MKKAIVGILMGSLVVSGSAYAEEMGASEIVSPSSEVYETVRLMEEAEYNLTEDATEKALLQDEYADKRLSEAEIALEENDKATAERVLEDLNGHVRELEVILDSAPANPEEQASESSSIEDLLRAKFAERTERLRALLERDDLPAQAKTGIVKAIEKHEQSVERAIVRIKDKLAKGKNDEDSIEEAKDAIEDTEDAIEDAIEEEEEAAEKLKKEEEKAIEAAERAAEKAEKEHVKAAEKLEKEKEKAEEAAERAAEKEQEKAIEAAERAAEKAEKEQERAKVAAERAAEKAEKEQEKAKEAAERAAEKAEKEQEKAAKKAANDSRKSKENDDNDEEDED